MDTAPTVIAIDGPSGSGKSTVARGVATRLGFGYLDTGAMYRAVTWLGLSDGTTPEELTEDRVVELLGDNGLTIDTDPADHEVVIGGHDVTDVIRGPEVTAAVSIVAAMPQVRAFLSYAQRELALAAVDSRGGIVVEGRDIGTVIFPGAGLKVWLTASAQARGHRRAAEQSGGTAAPATTVEGVVEDLARRDSLDSSRPIAPLQCAPDAHVIDTTGLSADGVIDAVLSLWHGVVDVTQHEQSATGVTR